MKRIDMTPEQREARNTYMRNRYADDKTGTKERMKKWRYENKERMKKWREEHREEIMENTKRWQYEHRDEYNALMRKQRAEDLNSAGVPKYRIRTKSKKILYKIHTKIQGYEIHHCFGYEDPNKFIYIPKYLHTQIHRLLRDNNIPADSNHWNAIRDLVNSCEEYTYIRT